MIPYPGIKASRMPDPDAKIIYADHMFGPAMLHYAPEDSDITAIAKSHGFTTKFVTMADDLAEDHPLMRSYENGECERVFAAWRPKSCHEDGGWKIAGCYDTEDGPVALYLRKIMQVSET